MRAWFAVLVAVVACGVPAAQEGSYTPTSPALENSAPDLKQLPEGVAEAVMKDAGARMPDELSDVGFLTVEPVLFTDSSLDCPQEGASYDAGPIDGFEVVVETEIGHLVYKVNDGGEFVLCLAESTEELVEVLADSNTGRDPIAGEPDIPEGFSDVVEFARADLSKRLGIDTSSITLVRFDEVDWPDASLGCPDPKKSYAQVIVNGFDIVFAAGGMEHHYHGGGDQAPFYCAIPTS